MTAPVSSLDTELSVYTRPGDFVYPVPWWCDEIDVVLLDGGQGGEGGLVSAVGEGGQAGRFRAATLVRGVDFTGDTITGTVGDGGRGGSTGNTVYERTLGGVTSINIDIPTMPATRQPGPDSFNSGDSPGLLVFNGHTYEGGGQQNQPGGAGQAPGGGGGGSSSGHTQGGNGAAGTAWFRARQTVHRAEGRYVGVTDPEGHGGYAPHAPQLDEFDGPRQVVYEIPWWCHAIDVVGLSGAGGGQGAFLRLNPPQRGGGGESGNWAGRTLVRGRDIPWEQSTLVLTIGGGGYGGQVEQPGGDGAAFMLRGFDVTAPGGLGEKGPGPAVNSIGQSAGVHRFNGQNYVGGGPQPDPGFDGVAPGGGGAGGGIQDSEFHTGGPGAAGKAWCYAYQTAGVRTARYVGVSAPAGRNHSVQRAEARYVGVSAPSGRSRATESNYVGVSAPFAVSQRLDNVGIFQGSWNPLTNSPDLTPAPAGGPPFSFPRNKDTWVVELVDPVTPEAAPAGLPGIGGETMHTGDLVEWDAVNSRYQLIPASIDTFTADQNADQHLITDLADPRTGAVGLNDAANRNYVDTSIAESVLYQGRWDVAANSPDLTPQPGTGPPYTFPMNAYTWIARTADHNVGEAAPAGLPGISGLTVYDGDNIIWIAAINEYVIETGGLNQAQADLRYARLVGGFGQYAAGEDYPTGRILHWGGDLYEVVSPITAAPAVPDPARWEQIGFTEAEADLLYAQLVGGFGLYTAGADYPVGRIIEYQNNFYRCTVPVTGAPPALDEADWQIYGTNQAATDALYAKLVGGFGVYTTGADYPVDRIIEHANTLYRCVVATPSAPAVFDPASWQMIGASVAYVDTGDQAARDYADAGDAAVRAYADAGDATVRADSDLRYAPFVGGFGDYTAGQDYAVGRIINYDGHQFRVTNAITNAPATPDHSNWVPTGAQQTDYWYGSIPGTDANWTIGNWSQLAAMTGYFNGEVTISAMINANTSNYRVSICALTSGGNLVLVNAQIQGTGAFTEFRLSSNAGVVSLEGKIANATKPSLRIVAVGATSNPAVNTTVIPNPPVAIAGGDGGLTGTQYDRISASAVPISQVDGDARYLQQSGADLRYAPIANGVYLYTTGAAYPVGRFVEYNNAFYECIVAVTVAPAVLEPAKWKLIGAGSASAYTTGANYAVGDLVAYDNLIFRCITPITGAPAAIGHANWQVFGQQQSDYWQGAITDPLWTTTNWVHVATLPVCWSGLVEIASDAVNTPGAYTVAISTGYDVAQLTVVSARHSGNGIFSSFRLSATAAGQPIRLEGRIAATNKPSNFKVFAAGTTPGAGANGVTVGPPVYTAGGVSMGGNEYVNSLLSAAQMLTQSAGDNRYPQLINGFGIYTTGLNYAVGQIVHYDGMLFQVTSAITTAAATPDHSKWKLLGKTATGFWQGAITGDPNWTAGNWVTLATFPPYSVGEISLTHNVGGNVGSQRLVWATSGQGSIAVTASSGAPLFSLYRLSSVATDQGKRLEGRIVLGAPLAFKIHAEGSTYGAPASGVMGAGGISVPSPPVATAGGATVGGTEHVNASPTALQLQTQAAADLRYAQLVGGFGTYTAGQNYAVGRILHYQWNLYQVTTAITNAPAAPNPANWHIIGGSGSTTTGPVYNAIELANRFLQYYQMASDAAGDIDSDPPVMLTNRNGIAVADANWVALSYLPTTGTVGVPFFFKRESSFAYTVSASRTDMAADLAMDANSIAVFVWTGTLWAFAGQITTSMGANQPLGTTTLNIPPGTAAAPSLSFGGNHASSDSNTGIFAPAADQIGFAAAGAERVRIDANGIEVGAGTAALPVISFGLRGSDTNTGMFSPAAEQIGFAVNGVETLRVDAGGIEVIKGTVAAPAINFARSGVADTDTGFYSTGDGNISIANNGVEIARFGLTNGIGIINAPASRSFVVQQDTNAARLQELIVGADAAARRTVGIYSNANGNVVGGSPEANLQGYISYGGYGWVRAFTTVMNATQAQPGFQVLGGITAGTSGTYSGTGTIRADGDISGATITNRSSATGKQDISYTPQGSIIDNLAVATYSMKTPDCYDAEGRLIRNPPAPPYDITKKRVGFIAEDLLKNRHTRDLVNHADKPDEMGIDLAQVLAVAVNEIQLLRKRVAQLEFDTR